MFAAETRFGEGKGIIRSYADGMSNSPGNVSYLLTENMIQGPMSIIAVQAETLDCQLPLVADVDTSTGRSSLENVKCYNGRTADVIPDGRESLEGYATDPIDTLSGGGHNIWMGGNLSTAWQQIEDLLYAQNTGL